MHKLVAKSLEEISGKFLMEISVKLLSEEFSADFLNKFQEKLTDYFPSGLLKEFSEGFQGRFKEKFIEKLPGNPGIPGDIDSPEISKKGCSVAF